MPGFIVDTRYGKIEGVQDGPVSVWRGVPFAQPPISSLRFRPPLPPQTWSGVRDASRFGPIAPQKVSLMARLTGRLRAEAQRA